MLTKGGEHFVTPMALGALAKSAVYTWLWDLKDEVEMGHIELSRAADFLLVCPATADLLAKMAGGHRRRPRDDAAARDRQAGGRRARR